MTLTHIRSVNVDIDLEIEFTYQRGYPETRVDPAEPASVEISEIYIHLPTGGRVKCPTWLLAMIDPDEWQDELCAAAQEDAAEAAADEADARAEGATQQAAEESYRAAFRFLWDSINGADPEKSWEANPLVWRIEFRKAEERTDGKT